MVNQLTMSFLITEQKEGSCEDFTFCKGGITMSMIDKSNGLKTF